MTGSDARDPHTLHVWTNPPGTVLPLKRSPVRFAVGTPMGPSTSSWKLWVRKDDIYVACRDNFSGFKVSLHASGIWRVGFTREFALERTDIVPEGQDRVMKKWMPRLDMPNQAVIGFQIVAPAASLYVRGDSRKTWPSSVVFVEPPSDAGQMVVMSVAVVPSQQPVVPKSEVTGGVAVVPIGNDRSVQLVATYEDVGDMLQLIERAWEHAVHQPGGLPALPDNGVFCVHGNRGEDVPWFSAVPFRRIASGDHVP
jgi:hypothetical protein